MGFCIYKHLYMNYYIDKYQQLINDCKEAKDYQKAYTRISSANASIILGRGFNQPIDEYLEQNPIKKEFNEWWKSIFNDLHVKAYGKPFTKPAQ